MKREYYIVQLESTLFAHGDSVFGFVAGFGAEGAARLCYAKAHKVYRDFLTLKEGGARRFPRILKVTVEMKTITPKRKGA